MMANELDDQSYNAESAFDDTGVQWLEALEDGHELSGLHEDVQNLVASACDFCAGAFDADLDEDLREDTYQGHQSFVEYFEDDWQVITF